MSWADNPVQYGVNSSGQTTMDVYGSGGAFPAGSYVYEKQAGGTYGWDMISSPTPTGPVATPTPPAPPPHLQFSANVVGTPIFLAYGACRLPGQIGWAPGIDATNDTLDTSLLTFAAFYCEPIDPTEDIYIASMTANGTQFYAAGPGAISSANVLTVANLSPDAQTQLIYSVASMRVYYGKEDQQPDQIIEEFVGTGQVPAYRGLRYIVFQDFPIEISNNSVPNITVEWRRTDGQQINVSAAMIKLIEAVNRRGQYRQALADNVLSTPQVIGIPDLCYGLTVTDQGSLLDHFTAHRNIYNFQIKEGDPITIVRRDVGSGLVIDIAVDEEDLVMDQNGGNPAMQVNRANPAEFPIGMNLSHSDPDHGYDIKIAPAVFDGSQPGRTTSTSSAVLSAQSSYIVDSTTARTLAYQAIFNLRSFSGHNIFTMRSVAAEVGDVVAVTTREGDLYVTLVESQIVTKTRSNAIQALQLLTQAGTGIDGDGGNYAGALSGKRKWPQEVLLADFVVSGSYVYAGYEFPHIASVNTWPIPSLRISKSRYRDMGAADTAGANWGASNIGLFPTTMFEDDFYVYWISFDYLVISRLAKGTLAAGSLETITIPQGFYVDGTSNDNINQAGNAGLCFRDGKLYIPWMGRFNNANFASANDIKLVVINVSAWDVTAWEIHDVFTYTSGAANLPTNALVLDNGTVVMPCSLGGSSGSTYFVADISNLSSWTSHSSSFTTLFNTYSVSAGNKVYLEENFTNGVAGQKHHIAILDFGSGYSETIVDLTDDPNIVATAQYRGSPWVSSTHYFVVCNHTRYINSDLPETAPRRYIARRKLSDGSADGGVFLDEVIWNGFDFYVFRGRYFDGKCYLQMDCFDRASSRFTEISEDLDPATAVTWWPQQAATPNNNLFANALAVITAHTYAADMRYCSTEPGEDYPPWATGTTGAVNDSHTYHNGHSLWFKFKPSASGTYTVEVASQVASIQGAQYGLAIWTGSALGALSNVAYHTPSGVTSGAIALAFSAVAGTTYYFSTYAYSQVGPVNTLDLLGGASDLDTSFGKIDLLVTGP